MKIFRKLIIYDFKLGGRQNLGKYFLAIIVFIFFCLKIMKIMEVIPSIEDMPSVLDCWTYVFKGQQIYIPSPNNKFDLPICWLMMQVLIAFLILHYPSSSLYSEGVQILLKAGNRTGWWISKCIWCIGTVISLYGICFLIMLLVSTLRSGGEIRFAVNTELMYSMNGIRIAEKTNFYLIAGIIILPVLVSVVLSLVQMLLSFLTNAVYSYFLIVAYLTVSVYFFHPLLLGSYGMLMRSDIVYAEGFNCYSVIGVLCIIGIVVMVVGAYYFRHKDILKKSGRN